jgi:hypothetical protein
MPSRWLTAPLLLLVPLVWRAGLALARAATRDAELSRFLGPAAALAMWLLGIHAVGLVSHSFYAGLVAGTILPAAVGAWSIRHTPEAESTGHRTSRWIWVGMAAAVAVLAGPELHYSKHDECLIVGHLSIPAEMQNGVYPPRHLAFPKFELRYHYGTDLLSAATSSLLGRLDVHLTVHALALLLWGYTFVLCWVLGERIIGGRASGPVTATCVLFAGGAPFFCRPLQPVVDYMTSNCRVAGTWITPPFVSNFLQHPWSLGAPLFIAILLVVTRLAKVRPSAWGWLLLWLLTVVVSLAQAVLFVCLVPTLVVAGAVDGRRVSLARLRDLSIWAALSFVSAKLLHGFFAPVVEPSAGRFEFHPFWLDASAHEWLAWHAQAFGALLPLGVAGFFFLRAHRLELGLLAGGGVLVRDLFRYVPGWNIVKFSMVSQIALAILASAALCAAFARPRWRVAGAAGLALATFFGFAWPLVLAANPPGRDCVPAQPSGADASAIDFLRRRVREGEGVFRSEGGEVYAMFGGLPQPGWDWGVQSFGFSEGLYDERRRMNAHPEDLEVLRQQGFRWLVLGPRDGAVIAAARRWVESGDAEIAAEFTPLTLFRLK